MFHSVAVPSRLAHMSSTCKTIALLVAVAIACPEEARPQTPAPQSAQDTARLASEIRQAKPEAIVEAGDTHDPVFIKDLRALRGSLGTKEGHLSRLLRISLAQLGDRDALQETYCRVQSQYPLIKQNAIENDLTKIGGWFSIWVLERQFDQDGRGYVVRPLRPLAATLMSLPRKCCKQKTYGIVKPFSCNTYKKVGVGALPDPSYTWLVPDALRGSYEVQFHRGDSSLRIIIRLRAASCKFLKRFSGQRSRCDSCRGG